MANQQDTPDRTTNETMSVAPIGTVEVGPAGSEVRIDAPFRTGLSGLADFGHVLVVWWADRIDVSERRSALVEEQPYRDGPEQLGVFATRSMVRPNPIGVSVATVIDIDEPAGVIRLDYLDAEPGTPVLDLKPYTPSVDRVAEPKVPSWSRSWPASVETSGDFDWGSVFG